MQLSHFQKLVALQRRFQVDDVGVLLILKSMSKKRSKKPTIKVEDSEETDEKETKNGEESEDRKPEVNGDEDEDDRQFRELTDRLKYLKEESKVIAQQIKEEEEEKLKADEIQRIKDLEAIKNRRRNIIERFRWYEK